VEGRGAETFKTFQERLLEKGGKVENIKAFSMDMSTSFISGAKEYFPKADIIFDKFHSKILMFRDAYIAAPRGLTIKFRQTKEEQAR
jgi:transposase